MIRLREAAAVMAIGMFAAGPALAQQNGSAPSDNQPAVSGAQTHSRMSGSTVRRVQRELKAQGLYEGHVDGRYGPETRNAIEQFQRSHNLTPSGQPDQETLAALQSGHNMPGAAGGGTVSGSAGAGAPSAGTNGEEPSPGSNAAATGAQTGTPATGQNVGGPGSGTAPTGTPQTGGTGPGR